jgi:teichuronic acid biosynthesis glycosyltransferase TuaG
MISKELVSIVTPAYRVADYVGAAIRSVQAQEYEHWELLIVDDCSPDNTCAEVERAAVGDPRVLLIRQPKNCGPAMARNAALGRAKGRFIAFLDSDDLWLPQKLSTQLEFMTARRAAITYTGFRRISQDGSTLGRLVRVPERVDYSELLRNTAIVTSSAMVDMSLTGPLEMPRAPYDDYALWLSLLRSGHCAYGLTQDLVRYRVVQNSVSRSKVGSARRVWRTYREIEHLSMAYSAWCFANYAIRGWLKYRVF